MFGDVEALTAAHLRGRPAVAAIAGDRILTRTPSTLMEPWVRLHQIDDRPLASSTALYLIAVWLQVDCYAGADRNGAQQQASLLARTVRDELHRMPGQLTGEMVVTAVAFGGIRRMPDGDLDPARERYTFDAEIWAHP